jgi:superfamily II DNA or RNA helicase
MGVSSSGEARRIEGRRLYGNRLLEPGAYRLPDPAIVAVFTEAWKNSTLVRGAFGWFSAGWISAFAHGIAEFLEHPDTRIDLTIAPVLFAEEHDAIAGVLAGTAVSQEDGLQRVIQLLDEGASSSSRLTRYAVQALAWLVVTKRLTLRVAVPVTGSNYHPKVWLFEDGYDTVAVRGSANATSRALLKAIEHLDIDPSWRDRYRVQAYSDMVDAWAAGADEMLVDTYVLDADVLASKVKRFAPPQAPSRREYDEAVEEDTPVPPSATETFDSPLQIPANLEWESGPYRHQGEAIRAWEDAGRRGILAIATGGGKTRTSLIAATRLHREIQRPLLLVVAVPTEPLLNQWLGDLKEFAPETDIVVPSLAGGPKKRTSLLNRILLNHLIADGNRVTIILTTFNLLSEAEFQNALSLALGNNPDALLIGDEVHGLGAEGFIGEPPEFFSYRLGLSATPERYEEEETSKLVAYFGPVVHTFTLPEAQRAGALVGYRYHITRVAELSPDEVADYRAASAKVGRASGKNDKKQLRAMLAQRRGILETADAKYPILSEVLDRVEADGPIRDTLIYCSSKQPEQLDRVCSILRARAIEYRSLTDDTSLPERDKALKDFGSGRVHVLVAKRILDEGVNIPSTRIAILMASSSSKREWVQRRGRVLRRAEGKDHAVIYDIPALTSTGADLSDRSHRLIIEQEHERLTTFNNESLEPELNNDYIRELRRRYLAARSN